RPCLHLITSNHYRNGGQWASFWDQHRGGFSCVDTVLGGQMTSHLDTNYVPTCPEPQDVRDFYIYENGKAWPMFPVVGYQEEQYSHFDCIQGLDTYTLISERNKLRCKLCVCVHPDLPAEIWNLTIKNMLDNERDLRWFTRIRVNID